MILDIDIDIDIDISTYILCLDIKHRCPVVYLDIGQWMAIWSDNKHKKTTTSIKISIGVNLLLTAGLYMDSLANYWSNAASTSRMYVGEKEMHKMVQSLNIGLVNFSFKNIFLHYIHFTSAW